MKKSPSGIAAMSLMARRKGSLTTALKIRKTLALGLGDIGDPHQRVRDGLRRFLYSYSFRSAPQLDRKIGSEESKRVLDALVTQGLDLESEIGGLDAMTEFNVAAVANCEMFCQIVFGAKS